MIAAWMLYCTAFGVLLALAAWLADHVVGRRGHETRLVWALALAGTALLPVVAMVTRDAPPAREVDGLVVPTDPAAGLVMESVVSLATLDDVLAGAWMVASGLLLAMLVAGWGRMWLRRRGWHECVVHHVPVLVSDDVGPAVVGVVGSRIVLPAWALEARPAEVLMMLRHEQEHLAQGDPRLVLLASLLVVAMPWNAPLWYLAGRLRLAVEVDCDRRVMRTGDLDVRSYAELLLAVGARRATPLPVMGFSVGRPFLETRIDRMTLPVDRKGSRASVLALVGVVLALATAWDLPQPVRATEVSDTFPACPTDTEAITRKVLDGMDWST